MIKLLKQYRELAVKGTTLNYDDVSSWKAELAALDAKLDQIVAVGTVVVKDGQDPQICDERAIQPNVSIVHKMPMGTVLYAFQETPNA